MGSVCTILLPPSSSPWSGMGKGCVLAFAGLIFVFFEKGVCFSPFHSVQDCIVYRHLTQFTQASKQVKSWITARQLNVTGLKTTTGRKQAFAYYKHDRGVELGLLWKIRTRTLPDCHYVLCVFFFFLNFKRFELLLFLSLTVTSNVITESSEKNRRTVQKSVIFTSKQLFCQSEKRSKKGKPFFVFTSKCFSKSGRQKGYFINNWLNGNYLLLFFYLCFWRSSGDELLIFT